MMRRRPGAVLSAVVISLTVVSLAAQRSAAPEAPPSAGGLRTNDTTILINSAMPVPSWALAERELLRLNAEGAAFWAQKYLDPNGHLRGEPHFGILDGPDDAVETIRNWPLAHALGGPESIIELWDRVWEGHVDQFSQASDPSTELAKTGMYYKEFPASDVTVGGRTFPIDAPYFSVRLAPGAGGTLTINRQRYAHQPTLAFPWDRGWMVKK